MIIEMLENMFYVHIQLKIIIDTGEDIPTTFEIYGIDIVYRAKNVK